MEFGVSVSCEEPERDWLSSIWKDAGWLLLLCPVVMKELYKEGCICICICICICNWELYIMYRCICILRSKECLIFKGGLLSMYCIDLIRNICMKQNTRVVLRECIMYLCIIWNDLLRYQCIYLLFEEIVCLCVCLCCWIIALIEFHFPIYWYMLNDWFTHYFECFIEYLLSIIIILSYLSKLVSFV